MVAMVGCDIPGVPPTTVELCRVTLARQQGDSDLTFTHQPRSDKQPYAQNSKTNRRQNNIMLSLKIFLLSIGRQGFHHGFRGRLNTIARRGVTTSQVHASSPLEYLFLKYRYLQNSADLEKPP